MENFCYTYSDDECCICYENYITIKNKTTNKICMLGELVPDCFEDGYIPDNIMFLSPCELHFVCVGCMRMIVNNYDNHPINKNNSHIYCPYPFKQCENDFGFKYIFEHSTIKKLCRTDSEWKNYQNYSSQFEFPGYTIIHCPCINTFIEDNYATTRRCNAIILVENDTFDNSIPGELILTCTQNPKCNRTFCYHCNKTSFFSMSSLCYSCRLSNENENQEYYNYYFNKNDIIDESSLVFFESEYLYKNKDISPEIAFEQLSNLILDVNTYIICPICKISLYKTEKCNAISHHGIERCYACGRIGFKSKGLGDHWNSFGRNGCIRFDNDQYIRETIPSYKCSDTQCSNHLLGDCKDSEHQEGILLMSESRIESYVYHALKSLTYDLQLKVHSMLFNKFKDTIHIKFIPYAQTLVLLNEFKDHYQDFSEKTFYKSINLPHPESIGIDKNEIANKITEYS